MTALLTLDNVHKNFGSSQVLRSVSDEKTTKLGTGRFWVIEVVYANQDGERVAVESYTGFGYRRGAVA